MNVIQFAVGGKDGGSTECAVTSRVDALRAIRTVNTWSYTVARHDGVRTRNGTTAPSFLASELYGGEGSASRTGRSYSLARTPGLGTFQSRSVNLGVGEKKSIDLVRNPAAVIQYSSLWSGHCNK